MITHITMITTNIKINIKAIREPQLMWLFSFAVIYSEV